MAGAPSPKVLIHPDFHRLEAELVALVRRHRSGPDDAFSPLWTRLGIGYEPMIAEYGVHCVTAQATTGFIKELTAGDLVVVDGAVIRVGGKSATFGLRMLHAETGALHATYEVVEVFFDPATRKAARMPDAVRVVLERWLTEVAEK